MTTAVQGATSGLHHDDAGVASALINTGQQIGGSISTALLTTIASSATTDYLTSHKPSALVAAQAAVEGYTATLAWGSGFFVTQPDPGMRAQQRRRRRLPHDRPMTAERLPRWVFTQAPNPTPGSRSPTSVRFSHGSVPRSPWSPQA
jgi:hypothetical protein